MSKQKQIGTKYENEIRDRLIKVIDEEAYRCGEIVGHPGDVQFDVVTTETILSHPDGGSVTKEIKRTFFIECKKRKTSWNEIYKWLAGTNVSKKKDVIDLKPNDFVMMRANRKETLVVMRFDQFATLMNGQIPDPVRG